MGTVDRAKKSYVPQFAQITLGVPVNAASVNAVLASSGAGGAALVYVSDDGTFWRSVEVAGVFTWVPQGGGPPGGYALPFYYVGAAGSGPGGTSPQFATIAAAIAAWLADGSPRVAIHLACGAYNETVQLEDKVQLIGDIDPFNNKNGATITGGIVVAPGSTGSAILENVECNNIGGDALVCTDAWTVVFLRCRFAGSSGVDVAWTSRGSLVLRDCTMAGEVRLLGDLGSGTLDAFATRFFGELMFGADCARGDLFDCWTFGRLVNNCTSQRVLLANHTARVLNGNAAYAIAFNATLVHKDGAVAARATPYVVTGFGTLKYTGVTWGEGDNLPAASIDPAVTVQTTGFAECYQPQTAAVPAAPGAVTLSAYAPDLVLLTGAVSGNCVMLPADAAFPGHPYTVKNTATVPHTLVASGLEFFDDAVTTALVLAPGGSYTLVAVRGAVPFWRVLGSFSISTGYVLPIYHVGPPGSGPTATSPVYPTLAAVTAQWVLDGSPFGAVFLFQPGTYVGGDLQYGMRLVGLGAKPSDVVFVGPGGGVPPLRYVAGGVLSPNIHVGLSNLSARMGFGPGQGFVALLIRGESPRVELRALELTADRPLSLASDVGLGLAYAELHDVRMVKTGPNPAISALHSSQAQGLGFKLVIFGIANRPALELENGSNWSVVGLRQIGGTSLASASTLEVDEFAIETDSLPTLTLAAGTVANTKFGTLKAVNAYLVARAGVGNAGLWRHAFTHYSDLAAVGPQIVSDSSTRDVGGHTQTIAGDGALGQIVDDVIFRGGVAVPLAITLPPVVERTRNRELRMKNRLAVVVNFTPFGAETVDGVAGVFTLLVGEGVTLLPDPAAGEWLVLGRS